MRLQDVISTLKFLWLINICLINIKYVEWIILYQIIWSSCRCVSIRCTRDLKRWVFRCSKWLQIWWKSIFVHIPIIRYLWFHRRAKVHAVFLFNNPHSMISAFLILSVYSCFLNRLRIGLSRRIAVLCLTYSTIVTLVTLVLNILVTAHINTIYSTILFQIHYILFLSLVTL